MSKASSETLVTCPDCGQGNLTPRGLAGHMGKGHCTRRAASTELEVIAPENGVIVNPNFASNPYGTLTLSGVEGVNVIRWLESALPIYERSRGQLARQAVMIGYALICIRDFGPRGSLAALKKMQAFARSESTLKRCIKAAQLYAEARGLVTATGQLAEVAEPEKLFHPEFDFSDPSAHPLSLDIAEYVGDANITDLLERDALEGDSSDTPQGHQKDSAKKRALKESPEVKRTRYQKAFAAWHELHGAGAWKFLYLHGDKGKKRLGSLHVESVLETALEAVRAHNKAEAAKERQR